MRIKLALLIACTLLASFVLPTSATTAGPRNATAAQSNSQGVRVGSRVMAPWSRAGKMFPGRVTELYGKLAKIDFDDGDRGWAELLRLRPSGTPRPTPPDRCRVRIGKRVKAPWSRSGAMYPGIVAEVHGKLAKVDFDDGDRGWALCSRIQEIRPVASSGPVLVGTRVMAPWSKSARRYAGTVRELYGKLARIDFDDGDRGWADVTQLRPRGRARPTPHDRCAVAVGQHVTAPWSRSNRMFPGVVAQVHGKLAKIHFDDGDRGWALCSAARTARPIGNGPAVVGSRVMAPWSSRGQMYPGVVTVLYGKLAKIDFDDGDQGWAEVAYLRPRGRARPTPADRCGLGVGQPVLAPWSRAKKMYPGRIRSVHGKLALVDFDDGDRGWALCAEIRRK